MKPNEKLKKLRKAKKLAGWELAQKIGCSQSLISHMETGNRSPTIPILQEILKEFGVTGYEKEKLFFEFGLISPSFQQKIITAMRCENAYNKIDSVLEFYAGVKE